MKKTKYYIRFENIETSMSGKIAISKKEFTKQLKYLRDQVENTKNNEYIVEEIETTVFDGLATTETIHAFQCGCAYTDLIESKCKDGYCFK